MKIKISKSQAMGVVEIIASKSYVHRALIAAALANSQSIITNVDLNDDIIRTLEGLNVLGANITYDDRKLMVTPIIVDKQKKIVINAHESGSTLRFLIPLATYLYDEVIFIASKDLLARPLDVYLDLYGKDKFTYLDENTLLVKGFPKQSEYHILGNISSQFITGLLFTLSLMEFDSKIVLTSELASKPYVDMTLAIMEEFGLEVKLANNQYLVSANQTYIGKALMAEGDFSQAAFFTVLGIINNDLKIKNLNFNSMQGDKQIFPILEALGAKFTYDDNSVSVYKTTIKGGLVDLNDIPDLGPILFVLALFATSETRFINIERLRIKESDRVGAMETELKKFGAKILVMDNEMIVYPLAKFNYVASVDSHNDHRIAMALSILATCLEYDLVIENAEAVNKSFPSFFTELSKLNIKVSEDTR